MSPAAPGGPARYVPDRRLSRAYHEANLLDEAGLQALCPSYIELSEIDATSRARNRAPAVVAALGLVALTIVGVLSVQRIRQQRELAADERDRATQFASKADTLDPSSVNSDPKFHEDRRFAVVFPDWEFSEQSRPSPGQLVAFFRQAREINPGHHPLMERILSYDSALRTDPADPADYARVVIAMLEYLNGGKDHLTGQYDPEEPSLFLWSDRGVRLLVAKGGGSEECLLRFLPISSLKLEIAGKFDLADLHTLQIEDLDLRGCAKVRLQKPVSLPRLRRVLIRPGQIAPRVLNRWIQSRARLRITEEAAEGP